MLLGGAALTRAYVEQDLAEVYAGEVRYARDAFEGLRLMDALMARQARRARRRRCRRCGSAGSSAGARRRCGATDRSRRHELPARSDVAADNAVPTPPFWGDRVVKGIAAGRLRRLARRAGDLHGPVGLQAAPAAARARRTRSWSRPRAGRGCAYWLDRIQTEGMLEAAVVYGYFPC